MKTAYATQYSDYAWKRWTTTTPYSATTVNIKFQQVA